MSTVKAADVKTYAFLAATPNPTGVNQDVLVMMWLDSPPATAVGPFGDRWQGYTVTITKPDGTTETKGPYTSDPVSGAYFMYTPTMIGKYKMQFSFPGQHITGSLVFLGPPIPIDNEYLPSTSRVLELTVQQNRVEGSREIPITTDYWTRPLYGENRNWASLGGNWLASAYDLTSRAFDGGCAVAPNKAPNTAHILWNQPITFGGLVGGDTALSYYAGLSYEMMFKPPIIIEGRLYYNIATPPRYGWVCVDLQTGEELWWHNSTSQLVLNFVFGGMDYAQLAFGQILNYQSPNQHGALAYLWSAPGGVLGISGGTWSMYDAWTGNWILDIANVPQGTIYYGPSGEIIVYSIDPVTNMLSMWNSTRCIAPPSVAAAGTSAWTWRPPMGATLDGTVGVQWTVPASTTPGQSILQITDVIYAGAGSSGLFGAPNQIIAYDKNNGALLWQSTIQRPQGLPSISSAQNIADGIYTEYAKETFQWYGYDVKTGQLKWGPSEAYSSDWAMYNAYEGKVEANGMLYVAGWDGHVYAHNLQTGQLAWQYYSGSSGADTDLPYGSVPFYGGVLVTDSKVFATPGEHSPGSPMPRGEKLHVMNANTGTSIWKLTGWFQHPVAADGKLLSLNGYDNQIYCFGKGPSATTVSAPQLVVAKGSSMVITGTVTDQSPDSKGTPAISDGDMSAWMEYLYMQQPMPTNAQGVQVTLTAKAPDGSTVNIGTATSDIGGNYGLVWTPQVEGTYKVMATFAGTESYGSSYATTTLGVTSANSSSTAPLDLYIIVATIILLIAIVIAIILLRRR
jgi:outer membrane protein assembly factor BamB